MLLIIGLGNPGGEFEGTRHNLGREILEKFGKQEDFPEFRFEKKWNAQVSEGKVAKSRREVGIPTSLSTKKKRASGEKVVLLLPDTFMNKSGSAVAPVARFYKTKPNDTYLVHDDADITLGRGKLSFGKRSAGHKGVESVMRALKTRDFWRFRIGIAGRRNIPAEKLVLKKFTPDEQSLIKKITKHTIEALHEAAEEGGERAMNVYNSK